MSNLIAVRNAIRAYDRAVRSAEIRELLEWDARTLSGTLSYMVKAKLVTREHTPEGLRYSLTEKGLRLVPRSPDSERAWVEHRATRRPLRKLAPAVDTPPQAEMAQRLLDPGEPVASPAPTADVVEPVECGGAAPPVQAEPGCRFRLADAQKEAAAVRQPSLADPVGLYARLCAVCDDADTLALDGVAQGLGIEVMQSILHATRDLHRAARAFARSTAA